MIFDNIFDKIRDQFLVRVPLWNFEWNGLLQDSTALCDQNLLLQQTVEHPRVKSHPVKLEYQRNFLKHIINELEKADCEVAEDLYSSYCRLLSNDNINSKTHFRHYILPEGLALERIVVQENNNLLSSGTTGLSCWQAGAALAEWCLANRSQLAKQCVLELGSGCGLTGLVAVAAGNASQVVLTDGHPAVVEQLCSNVKLNLNGSQDDLEGIERLRTSIGNTQVTVFDLPWEDVPQSTNLPTPDLILAADVVFDPSLFQALKNALIHLLTLNSNGCKAVLACTLRNEDTVEKFKQILASCGFTMQQETKEREQIFYYDRSTPVHFYEIYHKLNKSK